MYQRFALTIVDGIACIASTTSDFNAPRLITVHWPTTARARDVANYLDIPIERLAACTVRQSIPGEYYATNPGKDDAGTYCHGMTGIYLSLTHGGQTQPIKTDIADFPPPRNRGKRVEYRDGQWYKETAKGWKRY